MAKRKRRAFTKEFKAEAVRIVGATLIQICLGEFQVQFHFQAAGVVVG